MGSGAGKRSNLTMAFLYLEKVYWDFDLRETGGQLEVLLLCYQLMELLMGRSGHLKKKRGGWTRLKSVK